MDFLDSPLTTNIWYTVWFTVQLILCGDGSKETSDGSRKSILGDPIICGPKPPTFSNKIQGFLYITQNLGGGGGREPATPRSAIGNEIN